MGVKFSLEFNDETGPGFEQLIANFEKGESASTRFAESTARNAEQLETLDRKNRELTKSQLEWIRAYRESEAVSTEFGTSVDENIVALGILQRNMQGETLSAIESQNRAVGQSAVVMGTAADAEENMALAAAGLALKVRLATKVFNAIPGATDAATKGTNRLKNTTIGQTVVTSQAWKATEQHRKKLAELAGVQQDTAKSTSKLTRSLKASAVSAARIAAPYAAAAAAIGSVYAAFKLTGDEIEPVSDKISEESKRLADSINRGHKTVQEVTEQTGLSLEELGLKAEDNWDRVAEAVGRTSSMIASDIGSIATEAAKLTGIPQAAAAAWENFDESVTRGTQNLQENLGLVREGLDFVLGRSTELRKEQEKMAEEAERTAPFRKRAKEFEKNLQHEMELERELFEVRRMTTKEEVQDRLTAERQKREELIATGQFRGKTAQQTLTVITALAEREEALRQDQIERQEKAVKRSAEQRKKIRERELQEIQAKAEKEAEILREKEEKKQAILEEVEKGRRSLLEQRQDHFFESIKARLEAEEGNADKILAIEKEAAKTKAQTQIAAAESAEEIVRIRFELERKLRDLDLQHKIETEQKKAEASERAKQKELEDERKKIQALKQMQNEQGQNAFQAIVAKQSREKVLQEIVRDRIKEADEEQPDLSERRQRRRNIQIRRQVMQQAQGGQLNPGEIAQAQGDLAARQILQARAQGKLSDQMVKAMAQQAQAFAEQARTQEQLVEESREFQEFLRQQKQAARRRGQRLRDQRRGLRN